MAISPDEDDVLLMKAAAGIVSGDIFMVKDLDQGINKKIAERWNKGTTSGFIEEGRQPQLWEKWVDGLPCQLLSAKTGGWRKGTIRMVVKIGLEFTPDENEVTPLS